MSHRKKAPPTTKNCENCGAVFETTNTRGEKQRFCSVVCRSAYNHRITREREKELKACAAEVKRSSVRLLYSPSADWSTPATFGVQDARMTAQAGYFEPGSVLEYHGKRATVTKDNRLRIGGDVLTADKFLDGAQ